MKSVTRNLSVSLGRSNSARLTALLLLAVMVPSGCLLWFMNQAVQNERLAVRQKLMEAYRGHLSFAQERLDNYWQQMGRQVKTQAEIRTAPGLFAFLARQPWADSAVCFDTNGRVAYPTTGLLLTTEPTEPGWVLARSLEASDLAAAAAAYARLATQTTNVDLAALALQAQARCLVRSGAKAAAIEVLTGPLEAPRFREATDGKGRLIVPNARLMALELLKETSAPQVQSELAQLEQWLSDYDGVEIPSAQRRFLMREVQKLFPLQKLPMLAAEDLAVRYVETGQVGKPGLHETSLPGVWQFGWEQGRIVSLHRVDRLTLASEGDLFDQLQELVASKNLPAGMEVKLLRPGFDPDDTLLTLPASPEMAGWKLGLAVHDPKLFDVATKDRVASYLWIGLLMMATVIVLVVLAMGLIRRQAALTQLRNDLVANVTHELKTPLASTRLLVETLLDSEKLEEKTAREYLQLISRENLRLGRLIDNFLTFSRIQRNKYTFDFKEVPAASLAEHAIAAMRERFNTPGCQFQAHVPAELPKVRADADAMVTALVNLLDNAYKYSGESKQISLNASAENGCVKIAVQDNGIGLSPRDAERVFNRFFQVNQHLSRTSGGAGLGLSIVQFIVNAHGGTVQVQSELEKGSTFTVSLPVASTTIKTKAKL